MVIKPIHTFVTTSAMLAKLANLHHKICSQQEAQKSDGLWTNKSCILSNNARTYLIRMCITNAKMFTDNQQLYGIHPAPPLKFSVHF